ncbi:MAG: AIR synthase family protein [Candidatus Nezhaarchaeota archaeon]|nr:AIR synthase family protein [Candidatus Nezhaarchaeota archaeon]
MKLSIGKLPPIVLESLVFSRLGVTDSRVLIGPSVGEDAAIIDLGDDRILAIHVDPITEAIERIGWLSVHVASNDIAVRGVKPSWFLSTILLPSSSVEALDSITKQIDAALREVGGTMVGGHTEISPGVEKPIVVMTALGIGLKDELVLTKGARPGDLVLMTKAAGLEGTAIIASDFRERLLDLGVSQSIIEDALRYFNDISVVREALTLAKTKAPTSMHDPTEGGLLNGLLEVAIASGCVITIHEDKIPIRTSTKIICEALSIDPLKLISSGVLIATIKPELVDAALSSLKSIGISFSIIGEVVGRGVPKVLLHRVSGEVEEVSGYVRDEISKLWSNTVY